MNSKLHETISQLNLDYTKCFLFLLAGFFANNLTELSFAQEVQSKLVELAESENKDTYSDIDFFADIIIPKLQNPEKLQRDLMFENFQVFASSKVSNWYQFYQKFKTEYFDNTEESKLILKIFEHDYSNFPDQLWEDVT